MFQLKNFGVGRDQKTNQNFNQIFVKSPKFEIQNKNFACFSCIQPVGYEQLHVKFDISDFALKNSFYLLIYLLSLSKGWPKTYVGKIL